MYPDAYAHGQDDVACSNEAGRRSRSSLRYVFEKSWPGAGQSYYRFLPEVDARRGGGALNSSLANFSLSAPDM